jgi:hypothetical protein
MLPLDSRPPNWQFPQRLAAIGGLKLVLPSRSLLGSLRQGAEAVALLSWLGNVAAECDAAVLSWDALAYGGLIQSRQLDTTPDPELLFDKLARVDWGRTAGYLYITVPRLGISVGSRLQLKQHALVREYFIAHASAAQYPQEERWASVVKGLEIELGPQLVERLWAWRRRNQALALQAISLAAELGLRHCHIAVEDNAPVGPHIAELAELRAHALKVTGEQGGAERAPRYTYFDGADECAALLLARAALDRQGGAELPVRMLLHPASPGPENYTGLFETHTLDEGLRFLLRFLRLVSDEQAEGAWLLAYGLQPQPDVFDSDPARAFGNPYLLPAQLPLRPGTRLFVSDLCACNGANPNLALRLGELAGGALEGLVGYNTNFNTLGTTAAWLSLALRNPNTAQARQAGRRFLLERLADDVVYQSLLRPRVIEWLRRQGLDPFDFGALDATRLEQLSEIVQQGWRDWSRGPAAGLLDVLGLTGWPGAYGFPWQRSFECEADAAPRM